MLGIPALPMFMASFMLRTWFEGPILDKFVAETSLLSTRGIQETSPFKGENLSQGYTWQSCTWQYAGIWGIIFRWFFICTRVLQDEKSLRIWQRYYEPKVWEWECIICMVLSVTVNWITYMDIMQLKISAMILYTHYLKVLFLTRSAVSYYCLIVEGKLFTVDESNVKVTEFWGFIDVNKKKPPH